MHLVCRGLSGLRKIALRNFRHEALSGENVEKGDAVDSCIG